jgi:hypothetical protein
MTPGIMAEHQAIQSQDRALNIRKIQPSIRELYATFEDGQIISHHVEVIAEAACLLKEAVQLSASKAKDLYVAPVIEDDDG